MRGQSRLTLITRLATPAAQARGFRALRHHITPSERSPIVATRITKTVIDDFDGTDAAGTYRFALEDATFEIDLSEANLARLRDALTPFISAGRRLPKNQNVRAAARPNATSEAVKRVRRWWTDNQHRDDVPAYRANGRLPQQVVDVYQRATTPQQH
jgi:hypothetical protein